MSVYADKKNGTPTGRWRVELARKGFKTYKKRWDTFAEAKADEAAVLASWDAGEAVAGPGQAVGAPEVHTFASVIPQAEGNLWEGNDTEATAWARLKIVAGLLGMNTRLDAIDTQMIDGLIVKLRKQRKSSDGTVNRYLSILRTFLTWAKRRKYRTIPVEDIEFAWKDETAGRIRWITAEEEKALEVFFTDPERPEEHQVAAKAVWSLIRIAMATGCRRDELLTVEPKQINGTRLHLWVTKTETPRTIPMTPETTTMLRSLLKTGTMPTRRGLRSWWDRAKEALGLSEDNEFVFHVTRHTCATRMVDAGINVFVIKEWMGHKRLETTLRYAHVKPQNLEDALVRVGEYQSGARQNRPNSAENSLPLASPMGAGVGHYAHYGMAQT